MVRRRSERTIDPIQSRINELWNQIKGLKQGYAINYYTGNFDRDIKACQPQGTDKHGAPNAEKMLCAVRDAMNRLSRAGLILIDESETKIVGRDSDGKEIHVIRYLAVRTHTSINQDLVYYLNR